MAGRRRLVSPPEVAEVDHISHLPDVIIHHIFSFFLPFKNVVKTSVLSKRWSFSWTSTPYINLSPSEEGVVPWISRALSFCTATKIERFHLDASVSNLCIPTVLEGWFRFAVAHKVEDALLVSGYCNPNRVPRFLCDCVSLMSLQVSYCTFSWDTTIHWPSLKKLCLRYVFLDNNGIMKILSGCPVLESLTLHLRLRFWPGNCDLLQIDSRSLRELVIEANSISYLDISAPNLLSLRLSGKVFLVGFGLNGASSLAEAELNFGDPPSSCGYRIDQLKFLKFLLKFLLEQLKHVAKITIGSWCLRVLSAAEGRGTWYLSSRWRNILVYTAVGKSDLLGMAYLLRSSPLLERLVICNPKSNGFAFDYEDFPELRDFDEKQFWQSQKEFYCVANHLKRVEMFGYEFDNEKSKLLLALAKFLLEETVGLEKMIINAKLGMTRRGVAIDPHDLWDFHDVIRLQRGCRRASKNGEVIVNYRLNGLPYEFCKHKQNHRYWYRNKIACLFSCHFLRCANKSGLTNALTWLHSGFSEFRITFGSSFPDF